MLIDVDEERLLVISDLHLGNPFSVASDRLGGFLDYAGDEGFSVCINGDGLEILQASFYALADHSLDVLHSFQRLASRGCNIYYVIGNHDITLEHLLDTWLRDHVTPFLNVHSGSQRIRIEHGHLYDPFFVNRPRLYKFVTQATGPLLHLYPDVYYLWSRYQAYKEAKQKRLHPNREGHGSVFLEAAEMLCERGFDTVIFGHTHKARTSTLDCGGTYVNSGNWMRGDTYVEIIEGQVTLRRWRGQAPAAAQALLGPPPR